MTQQLNKLQQYYFPNLQIPIEIHAHAIQGGKGQRFKALDKKQRAALMNDAYAIIRDAGFPSVVTFASAIHVSAVQNPEHALRDCLEDLCQRFNNFLVHRFKQGRKDKGLLILDKSGRDRRIRTLMHEFSEQGTQYGYLGNIIDVPYFADSSHTRMLQLADLVAYAVNRAINQDDVGYLDLISKRFARSQSGGSSGPVVGLNHIVGPAFRCDCAVCQRVRQSQRRKGRHPRYPTGRRPIDPEQ